MSKLDKCSRVCFPSLSSQIAFLPQTCINLIFQNTLAFFRLAVSSTLDLFAASLLQPLNSVLQPHTALAGTMTSLTSAGSSIKFLPQGAIIQELAIEGHNIVLGFPSAGPYTYLNAPFFGETIGRYANRVKDGLIKNLNGRDYQLAQNNGKNSIHGGSVGWGKRPFKGPNMLTRNGKKTVEFTFSSQDGEEGYPGAVELRVWYSVLDSNENGQNKMIVDIEYEAELTGDACEETAINITNHSYFNLSGQPTIEGTQVTLGTNNHLPVDSEDIPLGHIEPFPNLQANEPFLLGAEEPDIDHCFIMDTDAFNIPVDTRNHPLSKLVSMSHSATGIHLEVYSTEPAFQFYLGKNISVPASEHGPERGPRSGMCVEPSRYVNAINHPEWRNMVVLRRGKKYGSHTRYVAWKA